MSAHDALSLAVNSRADVKQHKITDDDYCLIVDDFLLNPESVVAFAEQHADEFEIPPMSYPGLVRDLDERSARPLHSYIRQVHSRNLSFLRGGISINAVLSMTTLRPDELSNLQRLCHSDPRTRVDRANYAGLVYLYPDESLGGTAFYRWKDRPTMEQATALELKDPDKALEFLKQHYPTFNEPPCYITESNEIAELLTVVPPRFNRWVFYSGDIPHSAYITDPDKLSHNFSDGRLTLNVFASVVPR